MELVRSLKRNGNALPTVFSLLKNIPAGNVDPAQHGLRSPGAIYNLSLGRVLRAFGPVLNQLDALRLALYDANGDLKFDGGPLLGAQTELLESMLAHIDDAYQVLKACSPPNPGITEPFADKWLEKAKHPSVRRFKNAVKTYRTTVAPIVNRVKHEHGQLRSVVFMDKRDDERIGGYYLEGVIDTGGTLGPDREIHPYVTAFSFNRDLRLHFAEMFEIGEALREALLVALRAQHVPVPSGVVQDPSSELWA